ncbi:MAG TPA: hypothetical protein VNN07_12320 [Candidatus Tectomicrobia bacterium]|nr:hypothetical protein [Candidatus Tectomicrobia bacterium]
MSASKERFELSPDRERTLWWYLGLLMVTGAGVLVAIGLGIPSAVFGIPVLVAAMGLVVRRLGR